MMGEMPEKSVDAAQGASICTWMGIAVSFRVFYALTIDAAPLFSGGWIAALAAGLLAVPVMLALKRIRCAYPEAEAPQAFQYAAGKWLSGIAAAVLAAVLTYDAAAVLRLMGGTVRYAAVPEGSRIAIMGVTALAGVAASLRGAGSAANAAVLWKYLMWLLLGILLAAQLKNLHPSWVFPILGTGAETVFREAVPAAGMFCFAAGGWLMTGKAQDKRGTESVRGLIFGALSVSAAMLLFAMLIPGMLSEPLGRSFRIGRLLMNDRSGLSLEMPYVVLMYGGMLNMLGFELSAAAAALNMCIGRMKRGACVLAVGLLAFAAAVGGAAEREMLRSVSVWYYPLLAVPIFIAGRKRK